MRLLVTRPREDAASLVRRLGILGIDTLLEPLMEIRLLSGPALDLTGVGAIAMTSANGVRALVQRMERYELPVYAVGDASAMAARDAGFGSVENASGNVEALALLIRTHRGAADGDILHVAGSRVAGDLKGLLEEAGYTYRREVLYEAKPVESLGGKTIEFLTGGGVDGVLFFSPRTATTFVKLVEDKQTKIAWGNMVAYCLSRAVAEAVSALEWCNVRVAPSPDQESLLQLIDQDYQQTEH